MEGITGPDFIKALAQLEITYFDETSNDAYELFLK